MRDKDYQNVYLHQLSVLKMIYLWLQNLLIQAVVKETPNVLNTKDQRGSTPLVLACYYNNIEVVSYLIQNVDDINGSTKDGSPLMAATVKGYNFIAQLLLDTGADPMIEVTNNTTAFHYAAIFINQEMAQFHLGD